MIESPQIDSRLLESPLVSRQGVPSSLHDYSSPRPLSYLLNFQNSPPYVPKSQAPADRHLTSIMPVSKTAPFSMARCASHNDMPDTMTQLPIPPEIQKLELLDACLGSRSSDGGSPGTQNSRDPANDMPTRSNSKSDDDLVSAKEISATSIRSADINPSPSKQEPATDLSIIGSQTLNISLLNVQAKDWLSSTAIAEVLACVRPEDCLIFDPLFFNNDSLERLSSCHMPVHYVTKILVPIHCRERRHWYLASIMPKTSSISLYDSLACENISRSKSEQLLTLAKQIFPEQKNWEIHVAKCPQQPNSYDCEIYVIANAFFVMAQTPLPMAYDGNAWRLICHCLLQGSADNVGYSHMRGIQYNGIGLDSITYSLQQQSFDKAIATLSQDTLQAAKLYMQTVQAQQREIQSSLAMSRNMLAVIGILHHQVCQHGATLANQLQRDTVQFEKHSKLLEEYTSFASASGTEFQDSLPETQTTLSFMQIAHRKLAKDLLKIKVKKKLSDRNRARFAILIEASHKIKRKYELQHKQVENNEQEIRKHIKNWQQKFDAARRNLEQLLKGPV